MASIFCDGSFCDERLFFVYHLLFRTTFASPPMFSHPLLAPHPPALTSAARHALAQTEARERSLTKPAQSLGKLERITKHLAIWQEQALPKLDTVHTIVFAGKHGICEENVSAYPSSVTEQMVENFHNKGAAINQLCALAKASLSVYPIEFTATTRSFLRHPAMSEKTCTQALQQGIDAIPQPCDLLAIGEMGIGNTTSAAAMLVALYGDHLEKTAQEKTAQEKTAQEKTAREKIAREWTSSGTGIDPKMLCHKIQVVEESVRRFHKNHPLRFPSSAEQAWSVLVELGGFELAAIVGALLKARSARIPVLLDGYPCCAAAAVAQALNPQALENCLIAHLPQQQGADNLHQRLNCGSSLLQLDMRLGEASGAALAILVVRAAIACHSGMHSFDKAGVDKALEKQKTDGAE